MLRTPAGRTLWAVCRSSKSSSVRMADPPVNWSQPSQIDGGSVASIMGRKRSLIISIASRSRPARNMPSIT